MKLEQLVRTAGGKTAVLAALGIPLLQLVFPHLAYAQGISDTLKPTFEIKINSEQLNKLVTESTIIRLEGADGEVETVTSKFDPVEQRKQLLYTYFTEVRPSRLANHVDTLAQQPQWRKIVTISFVESTFCKHHYYNNCWGITYSSGLAKYGTLDEAIIDTNRVLDKFYADKSYEQMNCVYVQPCNPRWLRGVYQIEAELDKHGIQ